jgi:hypothetical protein
VEVTYTVAGLLGGVVLSALFWWVLAHRLVPDIQFSDGISVLPDPDFGGVRYRVKVKNGGRRDVIDLAIEARIRYPDRSRIRPGRSGTTSITRVPLSVERIARLRPNGNRLIWLDVHDAKPELIPPPIRERLVAREAGGLEALLTEFPGAHLQFQVLAYDAFSGSRKYYESQRYNAELIREGYFRGMSIVPETPRPDDPRLVQALSETPDE